MKTYILPLTDLHASLEAVGGKGVSLAKLANAGLPVPDGFHITTEAYRQFADVNNLQPSIQTTLNSADVSKPATLETASRKIGQLFAEGSIPGDLANAIVQAYAALPGSNPPVAVRSSATAEDLPDASFAGQQETYLNISGADKVLEAVKRCWASLWTARAIGYRARQQINTESVALAVVVQLLVNAEAAGIMFTANPLNGDRDEILINAAWGLGEAVVGGAVTPDTLTVSKQKECVIERTTAEKRIMTVRTTIGTEERLVPDALQNVPVLSDSQAAELGRYGMQIETLYGMPMDIEWTLADGHFAIVQARPVTALPEKPLDWAPPNPKGSYMRGSVADLMPKPLSPLFKTLWIPAQIEQMRPMGIKMTGVEPVLVSDYLTSINSYAYMNAAMPPRSLWWALTRLLPAYPKLMTGLVPFFHEELLPQYKDSAAGKGDQEPVRMPARALWNETQELVNAAAYYVCGLMFATMGASAGSEGLLTAVYNRLAKKEGDPDASALLMGWDNIPVRAEKSLYDLAMWVRQDQELAQYILETPSEEIAARLETGDSAPLPSFSEFAARFQAHLKNFGYIIFQLDFAEPLPRDHPEMMLENIKMYLRGEGTNPHERQEASERKRIETTAAMLMRLKGLKRWVFRKTLKWGQQLAAVREDALAEIGLTYPRIRELLQELGNRFAAAGVICQAEDIFDLEKEEIDRVIIKMERSEVLEDMSERVGKRKAFNDRLSQISPPPMIPVRKRVMGVKVDAFIAHTLEDQAEDVLKGVPTSAGKVTAPARVLRGPEDFDQMRPGDIIVAGATTPAWTPLFAMASAVVTDIGGPLSHGSIVAREYGIPAVMGTGIATKRIQNGQMITVDGNAGTVSLENGHDFSKEKP